MFVVFWGAFHSCQKAKKPDTAKPKRTKNAEKKDDNFFSVSAVVFTNRAPNFLWGGLKSANVC